MVQYLNDPKVKYIHDRLNEMFSMKSHRYDTYRTVNTEYRQYKRVQKQGDYARYRMNTGFALVNAKAAEILAATPAYDLIGLDSGGKKFKKPVKLLWDYIWLTSNTDFNIIKVVYDSLKYGVGWGMEYIRTEERKIKEPIKNKETGEIEFTEKEIYDYDGCYFEHIPWENVFVNGVDMNKTTEAAVVIHYDRDEFMKKYGENHLFSNVNEQSIPKGKFYYLPTTGGDAKLLIPDQSTITDDAQSQRKVSVLKYWNKYLDEYIVLANGVWINPYKGGAMPIPSPNKEIPLINFTDHYVEDDIWSMGEFDITKDSRDLKDESRSLILEAIKAQAGIITIDPNADWDEATLQLGIRKFARVAREDINFFAPSINAQTLQYLEAKLDEDIIIESGVDFKNQILGPAETATKTAGRVDAAKKRINLMMKFNAYTFFERLGRLRLSNMQFYYKDKERKITVKGKDYEGTEESCLNGGYGLFTFKPKYLEGDFSILPVVDSLMGDSSEKQKQKFIEFLQLVINMRNADGSPTFDPKLIVESGRGIIDDVVDLDKLLQKEDVEKTPEQILQEAMGEQSMGMGMEQMTANGAIPPAQRSGAPITLASTPGGV